MTQLERLKELFDEFGIKYDCEVRPAAGKIPGAAYPWSETTTPDDRGEWETDIQLETTEGDGYGGYYSEFRFNADGSFKYYAVWE